MLSEESKILLRSLPLEGPPHSPAKSLCTRVGMESAQCSRHGIQTEHVRNREVDRRWNVLECFHLTYKAGVNVKWLSITPTGKSLMTGLEYSLFFSLLRIDKETQRLSLGHNTGNY